MDKYLDYDDNNDCFRWGGSSKDLEKFINEVLEIDLTTVNGELREDKKHNAVTYKVMDCSIRFYLSTCMLKLYGSNQVKLLEKLHKIYEKNKNMVPLPSSSKNEVNGGEDDSQKHPGLLCVSCITEVLTDVEDEILSTQGTPVEIPTEGKVDLNLVLTEISKLRDEVSGIKKRLPQHDFGSLEDYQKEIDKLKEQDRIQKDMIQKLEKEKSCLLSAFIMLNEKRMDNEMLAMKCKNAQSELSEDQVYEKEARTSTYSTRREAEGSNTNKETVLETDYNGEVNRNNIRNRKKQRKRNKTSHGITKHDASTTTTTTTSDTASTTTVRKTTIIAGDSILSNVHGWKISDKTNKISVKSFSGAKVEDMIDYIKPSLKHKPDNLVLHIGTNNLKSSDATDIADQIVSLCEFIETKSPDINIAISQLTKRQDSTQLEEKRMAVNKILSSFTKTRDWKVISHHNIDAACLNGSNIHLNTRGTVALARNFKKYLVNNNKY